jgi:hypothetical protein
MGYPAPDHNTIDRFRRDRLSGCLDELFAQFVEKLYEWDEISFENLYIDGTKIEANANKYSFVWKKAVEKNSAKQAAKVAALLSGIDAEYGTEFGNTADKSVLRRAAEFLLNQKENLSVELCLEREKRRASFRI